MNKVIPLQGGAVNSHQIQFVQINNNLIEFRVNWRTYTETWVLDIYVEGDLIAAGLTLKPDAEISIMYPNIGERFFFVGDEPTLDNLGQSNQLVWMDA